MMDLNNKVIQDKTSCKLIPIIVTTVVSVVTGTFKRNPTVMGSCLYADSCYLAISGDSRNSQLLYMAALRLEANSLSPFSPSSCEVA